VRRRGFEFSSQIASDAASALVLLAPSTPGNAISAICTNDAVMCVLKDMLLCISFQVSEWFLLFLMFYG
jgi:hypothetical protein